MILAPIDIAVQSWHIAPLLGSCCLALNLILLRRLSANETQSSLIIYTPTVTAAVTGTALPWTWSAPSSEAIWMLLIVMGVLGGVAFLLRNLAYSSVPASTIAPLEYTQILFASVLGIVVFGAAPSTRLMTGAAILVFSNLAIVRARLGATENDVRESTESRT